MLAKSESEKEPGKRRVLNEFGTGRDPDIQETGIVPVDSGLDQLHDAQRKPKQNEPPGDAGLSRYLKNRECQKRKTNQTGKRLNDIKS